MAAVCVAQATAIFGFDFALPFMPLYLQQDLGVHGLGQIAIWSGIVGFGPAIPATIFGPMWGKLADKYGYRAMLLRAMASAALLLGLMGLAGSVWVLVALRMLQGGLTGTVFSAQALVASSAPEDETGRAMGLLQMSIYLGSTFGPVAGGLVAAVAGFRATFAVAGAMLALATVTVYMFVTEPERSPKIHPITDAPIEPGAPSSIIGLMAVAPFAAAILFIFVAQFAASSSYPVLPLYVQDLLRGHGSVSPDTGWLLAVSGVCAGLGSYAAGRIHRHQGLARPLAVAGVLGVVFLVAQAEAPSYLALLATRAGAAVALGGLFALAGVWVAGASPSGAKGLAFGIVGAASSMGFGAGPLIGGIIVSSFGIRSIFVIAAVLLFVTTVVTFVWSGSLMTRLSPAKIDLTPAGDAQRTTDDVETT